MDYEDIVIGAGLAALGAVIGLARSSSVMVLCGPSKGQFSYYDARGTVPSAFLGEGGLGNYWHGVIPTGWLSRYGSDDEGFVDLFNRFYPRADPRPRLGQPWLFVPWRPIRPRQEFSRLRQARGMRLELRPELAERLTIRGGIVEVHTGSGSFRARRAWVAAGALHTPQLLDRSLGGGIARGVVSDHVSCYVGQADGLPPPAIAKTLDGAFFPAWHNGMDDALYTLRPARFGFRSLDYGIEQRAVFGLPTGSAIAKITRRRSPGLLAEAFYNRFGLFPRASRYSIYAQVLVRDAYTVSADGMQLHARPAAIASATARARELAPFRGIRISQRPELSIPGIHLHHSVNLDTLARAGLDSPTSPVQVVDASVLHEIGPEHHSFKMMLSARARAMRAVELT